MALNTFLTLTFLLAAAFVLGPKHINGQCNVCNENGIACVNETSFNLCSGGKPKTDKVFTCPLNRICTATNAKCVDPASDEKSACGGNRGCGICDGSKIFVCTSRTTFAQCNGEKLTNITDVCPEGLTCDSQGGEICKNDCNRPSVIECDRDTPL